jgi:ribose transport system substrate-binding protein
MNRRQFLIAMGAVSAAAVWGRDDVARGTTADKPHVGVSIPSATHGWAGGMGWWADEETKKFGDVQWEVQRAGSAADQAAQIDAMVQKGVTAIAVLPFDSDTPLRSLKKAKDQGVYIVVVDRALREPIADLYVAGDNKAFGQKAADFMVKRLNGRGNVVALRGMPVEIDAERFDTFAAELKKHPGIQLLGAQPGNWNRQDAHAVMQAFLTKFDHIDAVWAADDDMALGVAQAIREAGRTGEMWILGGGGMKEIVKQVMDRDPQYPADVTYPPGMIAAGIALAVAGATDGNEKAVAGKIPESLKIDPAQLQAAAGDGKSQRTLRVDVQLVTPDNAKEFYFPESVY